MSEPGRLARGSRWFVARRRRVRAERAARELTEQRLELAHELHDTVAGQVGVIGIQAAAARRVLDTRPDEAAAALMRIEAAARAANADLRRMLDAFRGDGTSGSGGRTGARPSSTTWSERSRPGTRRCRSPSPRARSRSR